MSLPLGQEYVDFAHTLLHSRRNVLPIHLKAPGPSPEQLEIILSAASAAPDHKQLQPWRFVIVPAAQRERLGRAFGTALLLRDPGATPQQLDQAREKAHRAPFLMLAIARLGDASRGPGQAASSAPMSADHHAPEVSDAERLVSLGCAIQNIVLSAHAAGFGTGLTSGQAMTAAPLRELFGLQEHEHAVCCINIGTVATHKAGRVRPVVADYVSQLT